MQPGLKARSRVLIVGHRDETREVYAWCLRAAGWHVAEAPDGETALALAVQFEPDAIVIELSLPVLHGIDAIRQLREDARTSRAVIVVCTGDEGGRAEVLAAEAGCDAFVPKPWPPDDLRALLDALLTTRSTF